MAPTAQRVQIWIDVDSTRASSRLGGANCATGTPGGIASLVQERKPQQWNAGISWQFDQSPPCQLALGERFGRGQPQVLGLFGDKLTERHLAFLILVISEPLQSASLDALTRRRVRFRELLGMTEDGFNSWVSRNLTSQPGSILRWNDRSFGHGIPQTEGTWWIAAKERPSIPDRATRENFVELTAQATRRRRNEPEALLKDAESARSRDNWSHALDLADEAACVYSVRRYSRADPLWFQILLTIGGIEMQLCRPFSKPTIGTNIERSLKNPRQTISGTAAQVIRARAHHLAAIMRNQRGAREKQTIAELQISLDALSGLSESEAQHQSWIIQTYEELIKARVARAPQSKLSSPIWRAIPVFHDYGESWRAQQERMRYGEILLCAQRPVEALQHIEAALASKQLTTAAGVIAERLRIVGLWATDRNAKRAISRLQSLEASVAELNFHHQVRVIQKQILFIQQGSYRVV